MTEASVLNRDAGAHGITADQGELQAAIRAGEITWKRYPYCQYRYGERGERFTYSDTAWLATLIKSSEKIIIEQVGWLGVVLSSRGMPQIMLEKHLFVLVDELIKINPQNQKEYHRLLAGSEYLKKMRTTAIHEDRFSQLSSEFDRSIDPELIQAYMNMGEVIVSAVADERTGIDGAVSSLTEWICDPQRFDSDWIQQVKSIIRKARRTR